MSDDSLVLQVCENCSAVQYPPRECCRECLSDALAWNAVSAEGRVVAVTALQHSLEPVFQSQTPVHIANIRMETGVTILAFCDAGTTAGQVVNVSGANEGDRFGFQVVPKASEKTP